ncbi:tryptophan synthase subunit alpha [Streptomyces sp. NPDC059076]|uniref:tryptophan synthase subunit alpha n=1 Tax=unclassified Streptomyces TaxID=2593676 RepID=UPI0036B2E9C7
MPAPPHTLHDLLNQPRCHLGVFVPAGLQPPAAEQRTLDRLADAGADLLEVGLPTLTAPLDGPVIQTAYRHALREGIGSALDHTLHTVQHAARRAPTVVVTYWDPVSRGPERLTRSLASAGAVGVMVVDLPDDQAARWHEAARAAGLTAPRLAPRSATGPQQEAITANASGWLYAPAHATPTGYRGPLDLPALATAVQRLRAASPLPVVSGVGISTPRLAADVAPLVDAVIIGTPVVRALTQGPDEAGDLVAAYARALQHASR